MLQGMGEGVLPKILLLLFSIHSAAYAVTPLAGPNPIEVRVRIAEGVPHVVVRGFDLRIYETEKWGLKLVTAVDKTSEWEFRCQEGRIRVMALHSSHKSQAIELPKELKEPVSIQTPVGFLHYGSQPYRNEFNIYSSGLLCDVINHVELEKYLDGLVNSEFSAKWNEESIAAQVVVARTYAYYQILENSRKSGGKKIFDVDATVKDQVYDGSMKEDYHSSRIAAKTSGLVLTVGPEAHPVPIKAFYHSSCGGKTELPEHVWNRAYEGFKKQVTCPYCSKAPGFNWGIDFRTSDLAKAILKGAEREKVPKEELLLKNLRQASLVDFRLKYDPVSGRVASVVSVWVGASSILEFPFPAARLREWIGYGKLKSTTFQMIQHRTTEGIAWHFYGRGNGHGVGMCQWGAKAMGEKGFKVADILKFYYPDAILRKLW